MIRLEDKDFVDAPDADFEFASIRDRDGSIVGTPGSKKTYSDQHQFFEKLFAESGLVANGLLDNKTNGYQLFEALFIAMQRTNAPASFAGTLGLGNQTVTVTGDYSTEYGFKVGQNIRYANSSNTIYMQGVITGYTGSTLTIDVYDYSVGAATPATGQVFLAQQQITGKKIIEIGGWDMNSTVAGDESIVVTHGLASYIKLRSVSVIIQNDAQSQIYSLDFHSSNGAGAGHGLISDGTTAYQIHAKTGGFFDSSVFNDDGINRGWVTIEYEI